jgi:hypothetical protein
VKKLLAILEKWDAEGVKAADLAKLLDEAEAFAERLRDELNEEEEKAA